MIRTNFDGCLTASTQFRVPFNDIDVTGVAWHGRYFKYLEDARRTLYERIGYSYEEMLASGYLWPVADASIRYVRPLTLNQDVRVTACLREWELRLVVDYKIEDAGGTLCTKARTVQVPLDVENRELRFGSPQVLIDRVQEQLSRVAEST